MFWKVLWMFAMCMCFIVSWIKPVAISIVSGFFLILTVGVGKVIVELEELMELLVL